MGPSQNHGIGNLLLAAMPAESWLTLRPLMTFAPLELRQTLQRPDAIVDFAYFPDSGMLSMVANMADGGQAEVGLVGREGMVGMSLLSGADTSFAETMVQLEGGVWRMAAANFRSEIKTNAPFRSMVLRYSEALQAQVMQTAACNGRHGLEQRLARWLLMAQDRGANGNLRLTQEFLAMMLGVHRPSLTLSAGVLQRAGLIRYSGGEIAVLDRAGLEAASCECYAAVRRRSEALMNLV